MEETRLKKLELMRQKGVEPYGRHFRGSVAIKALLDNFQEGQEVRVAGRIMAVRSHGKSIFGDLRDQGAKLQFYIKLGTVSQEQFELFQNTVDIGDILGFSGKLFKTHTQEPTIEVKEYTVLAKSLRDLPEKWHGLKDVEMRFRKRYLDILVNEKVRQTFLARSRMVSKIREFLDTRGYLEVETPMLHQLAGGAAGTPFKTHHDALDADLFLRIAPELHLKRLLVAGFDKVYEINRSFRNEGISIRHNPEFTMLEVYTAYADCSDVMKLTQELITFLAKEITGKTKLDYQGKEIDLDNWQVVSFPELMAQNYDIHPHEDEKIWVAKLKKKGVVLEKDVVSRTQLLNIIAELIEPKAGAHPVFVTDLYAELCPLAKTKEGNPLLTDRFELFIAGMEVANAYSELNDPQEQRKRFTEQLADAGETHKIDEDFVTALEYGMPPAGGLGIGIDRLAMILTDSPSIREVILFPQLKPQENVSD
ncbi:MAG: lysine--tRNA ligase [Candidatus Omnitrophota bacterium]